MKTILRLLVKTRLNYNGSALNKSGFTMVELLVAMIMTFLILTPLLSFVVDMLNSDRREQVKANTEQEIQSAIDYIAQDMSQAVYIYDGTGVEGDSYNNNAIKNQLPAVTNGTPILVFWKRQQIRNALPTLATTSDCPRSPLDTTCNDAYVYSLVAYYLIKDNNSTWCQPSGNTCPARIGRYEIRDGVIDPRKKSPTDTTAPTAGDYIPGLTPSNTFAGFTDLLKTTVDSSKPILARQQQMNNWQRNGPSFGSPAPDPTQGILVNYLDTSTANVPAPVDCAAALGIPTPAPSNKLLVSDNSTNSFYACVDSSRTLARVFIRGNSLRRLQGDAPYKNSNSAYFPTASIQVQGLSNLAQ